MKKSTIIACVIGAVIGIFIIDAICVNNKCNGKECTIVATDQDMQNIHASIFNQIKSQGLVAEKYGKMVIEAMKVAIQGRYGANGSQAAMQWIKENNPTIPADIMSKLQTVIEAGYTSFEAKQRTKIDQLRVYKEFLGSCPQGNIAHMMGWPKIDMKNMSEVVSTAETKETFKTKEMKTIDPFAADSTSK
jgi:hypothetical protein